MSPYIMEQSIYEGKLELKALFQYVQDNAENLDLYQIETGISCKNTWIFCAIKSAVKTLMVESSDQKAKE
jgi:hypothetical protein